MEKTSPRIAIVGAGISGLVVAHMLHPRHEITVFEAGDYAGGHTNTIRVDSSDRSLNIDTGFIVFNDRNYPNFQRLLELLGVAWQPSCMSFSVSDGRDFEYASTSVNGLYARRAHLLDPDFHRMVLEVRRFQRAARELVTRHQDDPSLGEWLERERFSAAFVERLIVPQVSAVWSADPDQHSSFPARFLTEFFDNHGMLSLRDRPRWRVIRGGSARYVEALTAPFGQRLRLSTPVESVRRTEDHVLVRVRGHEEERFDEVVIATHSDQALDLLADPSPQERAVLGAIRYSHNEVVLHTDSRLLPRRRRAWASWNYHLRPEVLGRTTITYHMNRLQSLQSREQYCVTLNLGEEIDPAHIIRKIPYRHPVFTADGVRAQANVKDISGVRRTSYCGAYWGWGFHEDGVRSALRVAERFGVRL